MGRSGETLVVLSVVAIGAVLLRSYFSDLNIQEIAPEPIVTSPENGGVPQSREPTCPKDPHYNYVGLSKVVETPDVSLSDPRGIEAIRAANGWFVVNVGTPENPVYQLGRMYDDGSLRLGQTVPDLSLLGPSSIPEVPVSELTQGGDPFTQRAQEIPEQEMENFYHIETKNVLPDGYEKGLSRRAQSFNKPVEAGEYPVSDQEIRAVRDTVFDQVDYNRDSVVDGPNGPCTQPYYADTAAEKKIQGASLVTNEYPLLLQSNSEIQSWVRAHELGHALARVVSSTDAFNALPSLERQVILSELKNLQIALDAAHRPHSYDTGQEGVADLFAYLFKDPKFTKAHAPHAVKFFGELVDTHPELKKLLRFT